MFRLAGDRRYVRSPEHRVGLRGDAEFFDGLAADGLERMLTGLDMPSGRQPQAGQPVVAEQHLPARRSTSRKYETRCGDGVSGLSRRKMLSVPASHDRAFRLCSRPRSSTGSMPVIRSVIIDFRAVGIRCWPADPPGS